MQQLPKIAARLLYAGLGGTAGRCALGNGRGNGKDLRNPHTRKSGPGRKHKQGG